MPRTPILDRLPPWLANWLTGKRLRIQACLLAGASWSVYIINLAVPGPLDRFGNLKFQDFLAFYAAGHVIGQGRLHDLFNWRTGFAEMRALVPSARVHLPFVYGPQFSLLFTPFARLPFLQAAVLWVTICVLVYLSCCYLLWKVCPALQSELLLTCLLALAYPAFFHFFVRGQISVVILLLFVAAFFAFRAGHCWLAGFMLGFLIFKPTFLVAIPWVFLSARAWKAWAGTVTGAVVQLAAAWAYFGTALMRDYFGLMYHLPQLAKATEASEAAAQMHSLRAFWSLLIPWDYTATTLYLLSAIAIVVLAVRCWNSSGPLSLRFSALVMAAVLTNPHLFVYDLLVLAPVLMLLADWILNNQRAVQSPRFAVLLYLAYILPLFGPLTVITHMQLSVPVFALVEWELWTILRRERAALALASQPAIA